MYPHARNLRLTAAFTFAFCTLGAAAAPLNEAEALRIGLARPELAELAQARSGAADADLIEAGTWANPSLETSYDKTGATRETTWQLAQPIDLSGRRGLRQDAARHRVNAAEAENRAERIAQVADLRRAFHELLRQQETVAALEAWSARFARIGGVVDKLARAGEASGYDRRRLAREQQAAQARVAEAGADLDRRRARLAARLGQPVDDGVSGRLLPEPPASLPELQARLAQRPDLAALAARSDAAGADNAAARLLMPEVTVGVGGKTVEDGFGRESGTLLSLSVPLPIFDRRQAADRRTAAQAIAARAELGLARQRAEGELLGLHRQLTQLAAAAAAFRRDAVAPSAELVRIAEAAYRAGESTVLELLDAYKGALEAEITALDLEWKAREARIELDKLTGTQLQ